MLIKQTDENGRTHAILCGTVTAYNSERLIYEHTDAYGQKALTFRTAYDTKKVGEQTQRVFCQIKVKLSPAKKAMYSLAKELTAGENVIVLGKHSAEEYTKPDGTEVKYQQIYADTIIPIDRLIRGVTVGTAEYKKLKAEFGKTPNADNGEDTSDDGRYFD